MYDDAEATAFCPGCEFGVCEACMEKGAEGFCATCAEDMADRRANSAIQIARCAFCRAAEDPDTPLDKDGYCPVCAERTRCSTHPAALSVARCKGCRKPFCRQCLGFSDHCGACQASGRMAPAPPRRPAPAAKRPPTPTARPPANGTKKAAAGPAPKRPPSRSGALPAKGRAPNAKPRPPISRGEAALRARLEAEPRNRYLPWIGLGGFVAIAAVLALQAARGGP